MPRLFARVKKDSRFAPITACSGATFFRETWVPVPAGTEEEAKQNPYLDVELMEDEVIVKMVAPYPVTNTPDVDIEILGEEFTPTDEPDEPDEPDVPPPSQTVLDFANEHDIDLSTVTGTGKKGRIVKADVEALVPPADEP